MVMPHEFASQNNPNYSSYAAFNDTDRDKITSIRIEEDGEDITDLLEALHINGGLVLIENSVPIATVTVREKQSELASDPERVYLVRPIPCSSVDISEGSCFYVTTGSSRLIPDELHKVGGYFSPGTLLDLNDKSISFPAKGMPDTELFDESSPHDRILTEVRVHREISHFGILASTERTEPVTMPMSFGECAIFTNPGGRRERKSGIPYNQDAAGVIELDKNTTSAEAWLTVLDGNGPDGERVVQKCFEYFQNQGAHGATLVKAMQEVASFIRSNNTGDNAIHDSSGSTCSGARIFQHNEQLFVEFAQLGDSRQLLIQHLKPGNLQLTFVAPRFNVLEGFLAAGLNSDALRTIIRATIRSEDGNLVTQLEKDCPNIIEHIPVDALEFVEERLRKRISPESILDSIDQQILQRLQSNGIPDNTLAVAITKAIKSDDRSIERQLSTSLPEAARNDILAIERQLNMRLSTRDFVSKIGSVIFNSISLSNTDPVVPATTFPMKLNKGDIILQLSDGIVLTDEELLACCALDKNADAIARDIYTRNMDAIEGISIPDNYTCLCYRVGSEPK